MLTTSLVSVRIKHELDIGYLVSFSQEIGAEASSVIMAEVPGCTQVCGKCTRYYGAKPAVLTGRKILAHRTISLPALVEFNDMGLGTAYCKITGGAGRYAVGSDIGSALLGASVLVFAAAAYRV